MQRTGAALAAAALLSVFLAAPVSAQQVGAQEQPVTKTTAIAEFGAPLYPPDMPHWPYVNPNAPRGGSVTLGAFGSFDSLNTLIERGTWPTGVGLTSDSLMTGSADELFAAYGLIAETVEYPADKSWIVFNLRPEAKWGDGQPITAEDFVYSFDFIRQNGRLFLRSFFDDIEKCAALEPRRLKCDMRTKNTMKPLMAAAGLNPLPKHYWTQAGRDLTKTYLEPAVDSGPYRIKSVEAGRSITYERVKNHWAENLPIRRGMNNFDEIRYEYYRDDTVMFEAFMAGRSDFWSENRASRWATGYDVDPVKSGRVVRWEPEDHDPRGVMGYVFNTRRANLQDIRVRKALNYLYDFETTQRQLLFGQYKRVKSWFPNSEYGAKGPPTAEELAILEPFKDKLPAEALTQAYEPPATDGSGQNRANQREAFRLFKEAGWELKNGKLLNAKTGEPFKFEILMRDPAFVRVTEPFVQGLKKAGIEADIRVVDTAQYQVRTDEYDFDVVVLGLTFYPPPGPELKSYYSSKVADVKGQGNFAAIRDPVVDALLDKIVTGQDLPTIQAQTRAMDRALLWGWYLIPLWYNDTDRLAWWDRFAKPETRGKYSVGFPATWWIDPAKDAKLNRRGG
jgi:microcin C transport system substrate-binding protein